MTNNEPSPLGSECNAELGATFLHARDGGAAYPADLVRTWPAHNRARFVAPLYDQDALDAAVAEANRRQNAAWALMAEKLVAAERERCAQYLRDAAKRLTPEGKRTNQVDRHTAHVLATKGDELAHGCHVRA